MPEPFAVEPLAQAILAAPDLVVFEGMNPRQAHHFFDAEERDALVRGAVAGMQKSTGILDVVRVMWEELKGLGLEFAGCNISTIDEARNMCTLYTVLEEKNL